MQVKTEAYHWILSELEYHLQAQGYQSPWVPAIVVPLQLITFVKNKCSSTLYCSQEITESWNGLGWKRPKRLSSSNIAAMDRELFTQPGHSGPCPTWPWALPRDGESSATLSNLFQCCLIVLTVKKVFPILNLKFPSFSLKPQPLVLSLHALAKAHLQLSCRHLSGTGRSLQQSHGDLLPFLLYIFYIFLVFLVYILLAWYCNLVLLFS